MTGRTGQRRSGHDGRGGFTIVELLVVLAIIGILMALAIPAVQMARESARRTTCANHLKQMGLAIDQHEQAHGFLPTGGWGGDWVGDPDAGYDRDQPGGWIYNILPYIEQEALRGIGRGLPGRKKRHALAALLERPLELFHCPSRRAAKAYPYHGPARLKNADPPPRVAKTDYVVSRLISFRRSDVIVAEIRAGMSQVVLVGEKAVPEAEYDTGRADGDRLAMYAGDSPDIGRAVGPAQADASGSGGGFGSAHPGGCQFVFGDGSVRWISFGTEPQPGAAGGEP